MSSPIILVAIDIVEDQVVRLRQGELQERTVYGHDPVETAVEWERSGAEWLHVVDLEGATRGEQANSKAIEEILKTVKIPVQVGGGLRSLSSIEAWLGKGASRVSIGTKALDPAFLSEALEEFADRIVASVDARQGEVRVEGWTHGSGSRAVEVAKRLAEAGVRRVVFTDIERDGTLQGPNFEGVREIVEAVEIPVIASGGVDTEFSIRKLAKFAEDGLEGIIIGKALYSGALSLDTAKQAAAADAG
ncbi:MAG: 1-(5-phosphoribosyl)-5-[(5-phosphoribosylamino)methylideneamino]imidazole-4-carboxamide isomerase [Acidimicrobiia bacterium]